MSNDQDAVKPKMQDWEGLRHFLGLDEETTKQLPHVWRLLEPALPTILDRFYEKIQGRANLARILVGKDAGIHLAVIGEDHGHLIVVLNNGAGRDNVAKEIGQIGAISPR